MQFINISTGGTLKFELPNYPTNSTGSVHVHIFNPAGSQVVTSASTTVDSVNTHVQTAVSGTQVAFTLDSTTGVVSGRRYFLDGPENTGGESVTVKSVSGSTVTLYRPLERSHTSGSQFFGTLLQTTISGSQLGTVGKHYRAEAHWYLNDVEQAPMVVDFHCVRFSPESYLTLEDIRDLDPTLLQKWPKGMVFDKIRAKTKEMMLNRVASTVDPGSIVGIVDLTVAHSFLVRSEIALTAGPDWNDYRDKMVQRYQEEFEAALQANAIDSNQDGQIGVNEYFRKTIRLVRG